MTYQKEISRWLSGSKKNAIKLLQRLIQEPSKRGNEGKAQAIIVEKCRELGLEIDLWEIGDETLRNHPRFYCDRTDFSENPNLIAVKKGSGGGRSLILNGHIDVVPEGNEEDWDDDPYSGNFHEGRIYGRGASDMKGGTVSLLLALEALAALNIPLKGDVIFQSVIEEESGGAGTLAAVLRGYKADGAIIPEPTNMKIFPLQQGSMWFRLTIKGKSAHGGTRYEGVSAVDLASEVLAEIKRLEEKRNGNIKSRLYENIPIPIPINIGKISAGEWPSSVPDKAVIEGRFGISPWETVESAEQALERFVSEINASHEWFQKKPVELEWFGARWLPGNLDLEHPLLQAISNEYRRALGSEPVLEASPWGTDGGYLSNVGETPVIVFGPGVTEKAHEANEYIEVDKLIQAAEVIALTIINWCGIKSD
jgi:acetylornithine deacetylase